MQLKEHFELACQAYALFMVQKTTDFDLKLARYLMGEGKS